MKARITLVTMTAAARRAEDKRQFNAFYADCASREVLSIMSDKWVVLVVNALVDGPKRHSELARRIAGVSQKMLTQTLRSLERDGLVSRRVTAQVPVRVDYELTDLGRSFSPVMEQIKAWAEGHILEIEAARVRFDEDASA